MSLSRPAPVFPVTSDVVGLRTMMVNVYFVRVADGARDWVLVDGGLRGGATRIRAEAELRFGRGRAPRAVILTHGHFDHVGALPRLLGGWDDVPVYAHPAELPFINHGVAYPKPDPEAGGGWLARGAFLFPRHAAALPVRVQPLPAEGTVPELEGWRWIATPGHTPGHVSLWRERDRLLLAGDAIVATRQESARAVWRQTRELRPPPTFLTPDWRNACASIRRLHELEPEIAATGHGLPMRGPPLHAGLDALTRRFARPGTPSEAPSVITGRS